MAALVEDMAKRQLLPAVLVARLHAALLAAAAAATRGVHIRSEDSSRPVTGI